MVTMKDVAKKAGVSEATVSRVLSGRPNVSVEMRSRVLAVADQLGYVPNLAARALVTGKKLSSSGGKGVGVVVSSSAMKFSHAFFSEILDAIDEELEFHGKWIAYVKDSEEVQQNPQIMHLMSTQQVEALVLIGNRASFPFAERVMQQEMPVVLLGFSLPGHTSILFDKDTGMKEVIQHLMQLGHTKLAYIGGNDERRSSFLGRIRSLGLPFEEHWDANCEWSTDAGYQVAYELFSSAKLKPTAVVAGCDTIAMGVVRALYECGLRVPDDISVTGFDDLTFSRYMVPSLTTVRVHRKDIGQFVARRIIDELERKSEASIQACSPVKLVVRESTGPCPQ